jgi:hypothetical protein
MSPEKCTARFNGRRKAPDGVMHDLLSTLHSIEILVPGRNLVGLLCWGFGATFNGGGCVCIGSGPAAVVPGRDVLFPRLI